MSEQTVKTRGNLVGDVIAGLTTGVANIPDPMAAAILAGANPVQGLYAIMIGTPLGAIFGKGQLDRTETTTEILGGDNVFVATPILGASTRAAVAAAERWLQAGQVTEQAAEAAQAEPRVQANGQAPAAMEQML